MKWECVPAYAERKKENRGEARMQQDVSSVPRRPARLLEVEQACSSLARHFLSSKKERKKTDTPNEGWDEDRVPTCTSRILEERSGGQVGLSCS